MADWAGRRLGATFHPPFEAWGIADNEGRVIGAVVFNDYTEKNVEVSVVGKGWNRNTLIALGKHCFEHLGCNRVSITTRSKNTLVRILAERLGGTLEGIKRKFYDDDDAVIYGILKEEYRYGNHGRRDAPSGNATSGTVSDDADRRC